MMMNRNNKAPTAVRLQQPAGTSIGSNSNKASLPQDEQQQQQRSVVRLSPRALLALLVGCTAASFGAGRWFAVVTQEETRRRTASLLVTRRHPDDGAPILDPKRDEDEEEEEEDRTRYIFDHFDDTHAVRSYACWRDPDRGGATTCSGAGSGGNNGTCAATATATTATVPPSGPTVPPGDSVAAGAASSSSSSTVKPQQAETMIDGSLPPPQTTTHHEPVGQQLLLDLDRVDSEFLDSEDRLAQAMMALVADHASVRMLSYHCHGMHPAGVSCVGVLHPGGAVTFHTWPAEGVITLDLLVTGSSSTSFSLLRLLDRAQALFGVPAASEEEGEGSPPPSRVVWALKRRGFRRATMTTYNPEDDEQWILNVANRNDRKALVASIQTPFQSVDIFDVAEQGFGGGGGVDRMVFLDRILQSSRFGEAAYHEALVHPALLAHDNPRRVVIIGGGEGATLREVLKHRTVEEAIMVEIDATMVQVSREYLPEWSDCSNLRGSADSCFDDPRATVYHEDAIQWFIDRYGGNGTVAEEKLIDIIIMDALDPTSFVEFSDLLYDSELLMRAFSNALGEEGILVSQFGEADEVDDPPESLRPDDNVPKFLSSLEHFGFESIIEYDEDHGQSVELRSYLMAMKDGAARTKWFMNEAELQLAIKKRTIGTKDGSPPFRFFDAATMMQYQFPSRLAETKQCLDEPNECVDGHGFDPEVPNFPVSSLEVKPSVVANGESGVFAKEFIPKGSLIGLEECVHGMFAPSTTVQVMNSSDESFGEMSGFWKVVYNGYFDGYGWTKNTNGEPSAGADAGILAVVNHGCNGTYNVGSKLNETEATLELGQEPHGDYDSYNDAYNPFRERHFPLWACSKFRTLRDVEVGEELLDN